MVGLLCGVHLFASISRLCPNTTPSSYDALKKLFPSTPLDPSYRATHQNDESSAILPLRRDLKKYASPENFKQALDKERSKVTEFYKSKFEELTGSFEQLEDEVARMEERDLVQDDTIKEVDEENEDAEGGPDEQQDNPSTRETDNLLGPSSSPTRARSPLSRPRPSFVGRLGSSFNFGRRKSAALPSSRDPDILEASIQPTYRPSRSPGATRTRMSDSMTSSYFDESPSGRVPGPRSGRRVSDLESSVDDIRTTSGGHDRRTSVSSLSSHEGDFNWPRRLYHSLGLVQMDPATVPDWAATSVGDVEEGRYGFLHGPNAKQAIFVWTANNDYATVLRIGLKKRISKVWLDAYALKQYVELNMTAFEKILKKYDKNTDSKVCNRQINNGVTLC